MIVVFFNNLVYCLRIVYSFKSVLKYNSKYASRTFFMRDTFLIKIQIRYRSLTTAFCQSEYHLYGFDKGEKCPRQEGCQDSCESSNILLPIVDKISKLLKVK